MSTVSPDPDSETHRVFLNQLQIISPCDVAWESMAGSARERHCDSCVKQVHNLIEHTAAEAIGLITTRGTHVCVRMYRDAAGNVLTKDSPASVATARRGLWQRLMLFAASWLGLTTPGCMPTATSGHFCLPPAGAYPSSSATPTGSAVTSNATTRPNDGTSLLSGSVQVVTGDAPSAKVSSPRLPKAPIE